jgi:Ca2+-binding RTX toxin-like protein
MAIITGTSNPETLNGTASADTISGLAGNDTLNGNGGIDRVSGGQGNDRINGGDGDDYLYGYASSDIQGGPGGIRATLISNAFARPVFATSAPGDTDRLYVVEAHTGQIRILDPATGAINATPFLDIPDAEMSRGGEEGLLGLAFHPNYATNGQFFVFLTNAAGNLEVRRYQRSAANPDRADPAGDIILQIPHPGESNHNGGWMGFGPDGFLYISVGDGGGGGDPNNNAQNKDVLLGKMLRIDVNGDAFAGDPNRDYRIPTSNPFVGVAGADEIWAYGLRNGWRPSFDRLTGDLYIADVGQGAREEINFQAASSAGGENYGWKVKEGFQVFDDTVPGNPPPTTPPLTDPVIDYPHVAGPGGGFSVTGGYVYRGASPYLQGHYFFADFVTDQLWTIRVVNGVATEFTNRTAELEVSGGAVDSIASFAEDGNGNLYIIGLDGEVHRLEPDAAAGDGNDTIDGGTGNDRIYGGAGADRLMGGIGDDYVFGGTRNDMIDGNDGDDALYGGADADSMRGGGGADRLFGEAGNDPYLAGDAGADFIQGGLGNDRLDGGADADMLYGNENSDFVSGGSGGDTIYGGDGDDGNGLGILRGEDGNDALFGQAGIDRLEGGNGNDRLNGGSGPDVLVGGTGLDVFVFQFKSDGNDRIDDWVAVDDQLEIDASNFGGGLVAGALAANRLVLGAAATQAFGQFLYNTTTGQLSWDADGTGAGAAVQIARFLNAGVAVALLTSSEFDIVA